MSETPQTQETQTVHGLDVAAHAEFIAFAEENPEAVQLELSAVGTDEGRVLHTRSKTQSYSFGDEDIDRTAREYTHHFGGHREVEAALGFVDPTDRKAPIEVALAALTSSINGAISLGAVQAGMDIDAIETSVSVDFDPSILLGLEPVKDAGGAQTDMYGDFGIDVQVSGDDLDDEALEEIEEWVARSPVYNLLSRGRNAAPHVSLMDAQHD